jgi:hypothetical protein
MSDKFNKNLEFLIADEISELEKNHYEFGDDIDLKRSYIKRNIQLMIYTHLDNTINKLVK